MAKIKKRKLRGKDLVAIGYQDTTLRSLAMQLVKKNYKYHNFKEKIDLLKKIITHPKTYKTDAIWSPLAHRILDLADQTEPTYFFEPKPFKIYGKEGIANNAITQMKQAMSLPIALEGALMPDAHHGYGLPIGGVVATQNAIMPYGVGMDIGCRMCLSIFPVQASFLTNNTAKLKSILQKHSRFGRSIFEDKKRNDAIFDRSEFNEFAFLRRLKDKAYQQIGSSGGGNHFVDFGFVQITEPNNDLDLEIGNYFALLSHSGSRGFGASIANTYTNLAIQKRKMPKKIAHLAWLSMDEEAGQEYWIGMNLAGDYASACHHHIHRRISTALGMQSIKMIENHHNFAWKDTLANGKEVYIHRKGATPAHQGEWGIIPGSMTAPAFIVRGLGNPNSLHSAAHGAGRAMSRQKAKQSFTKKMMRELLQEKQVELIGADVDESPLAYKNIHQVMQSQQDLVNIVAAFYPKIVRMEA